MRFPWKSNEEGDDGRTPGYYDSASESSGPPLEAVVTIPIHPGTGASGKARQKASGADYSHLLSPLYAILMVLIGLLLPMTEALQHQWHMTIYNMIYNVYSLGLAVLSVVFLQWLLLHQRHDHIKHAASSDDGIFADEIPRPPSPEIVVPSITVPQITITTPTPMPDDDDDDKNDNNDNNNDNNSDNDVKPVEIQSSVSAPSPAVDRPTSSASNDVSDDDSRSDVLPSPDLAKRARSNSVVSTNVLQMINEQRRFSVSATSAKSANTGGVTAKIRLGGAAEREAGRKLAPQADADNEVEDEAWIDLMKLGSVFSHEGSNLYLRLWQLGFALGNVVYIILEIQFQMSGTTVECSGTYGWTFVFRLAFIITQTFFLFKNQTMEVKSHEVIVRFALMHLIATNTSVWLRTLINEIMFEYEHFQHHDDDHHGDSPADNSTPGHDVLTGDCLKFDKLIESTSPFLFPFVLEYSLIAMGTLAVMYSAVSEATDEQANTLRRIQNLFRVPALSANYAEDGGHEQILQKSHRGFFAGILVLSGTFVAIIMFYFSTDDTTKQAVIYLVTLIIQLGIMLLATGVALYKINQLSYIARPVSVDDILLLVAMCGEVMYELSIVMASANYVSTHSGTGAHDSHHDDDGHGHQSDSDDHMLTESLRLAASSLSVIQAVFQVLLTIGGLRRYPLSQSHLETMPGRGLITFLIVTNVSVWICRTALVKGVSPETMLDYYTTLPWLLLSNINLPLLLFYRFHSSFCLADIWHSAYTYPSASSEHKSKPAAPSKTTTSDRRRSIMFSSDEKTAASNGVVKRYTLGDDSVA